MTVEAPKLLDAEPACPILSSSPARLRTAPPPERHVHEIDRPWSDSRCPAARACDPRPRAGCCGRRESVPQVPGLPPDRRDREEWRRTRAERRHRPACRDLSGLLLLGGQQDLRAHL